MFRRMIEKVVRRAAREYPVIALMGPRQSGKTTLVRYLFGDKSYFNLEEPDTRALIESDPRHFFARHPDGAILDEIQRVPSLLSYIQAIVDQSDKTGVFILTGSHQLALHQAVSQSLAGRVALFDLLPLCLGEIRDELKSISLFEELLIRGFFPRIYAQHVDPAATYRNYVRTYIERDVRTLVNVKDLAQFQRFMKLSAGRIGNILNIESLCGEVGIAHKTLNSWLSVLEASYLVIRIQPYFENFGKRLIKSPKIYFTDVGLASYLLGVQTAEQLTRDPMRGHLFENLVIMELIKFRYNQAEEPEIYYYRDNHGHEVDVILKLGHQLIPVEIKSTQTFNPALLKNLRFFKELVGDRCPLGFLIYAGELEQPVGDFFVVNYKNSDSIFEKLKSI